MLYGENGAYMCYEENEKKKTRKIEMAEITIEQRWQERERERERERKKEKRKEDKQKESKKKSRKEQQKKKATRKKILEKSKGIYCQPLEYLF